MESFLLDPIEARKEMSKKWGLKDFLGVTKMGEGKFLLEFASKGEAARVLQNGERKFSSFNIDLCWRGPSEGCILSSNSMKELWVRLVSLPAHLWEIQTLERLGDACGGFIAVDKPARALSDLQWTHIRVCVDGRTLPQEMVMKSAGSILKIQLWWEIPLVLNELTAKKT